MVKKPRLYSREKRKEQVINQFNIWHMNNDEKPKTMNRIARALDLVPSQKFTDILLEMVDEGSLTFEWRDASGRWTARDYSLIKSLIREKFLKREIKVNKRGVAVGQLEMFS